MDWPRFICVCVNPFGFALLFFVASLLVDGRVLEVVSFKALRLPRTEKTFMTVGRDGGVFSFAASLVFWPSSNSHGKAGGLDGGVPERVASSEKLFGMGVEGGTVLSERMVAAIIVIVKNTLKDVYRSAVQPRCFSEYVQVKFTNEARLRISNTRLARASSAVW
jgi:hypothetical protein